MSGDKRENGARETSMTPPAAAYGPFVMNTRQQIIEALEDYEAGRLGTIPVSRESL